MASAYCSIVSYKEQFHRKNSVEKIKVSPSLKKIGRALMMVDRGQINTIPLQQEGQWENTKYGVVFSYVSAFMCLMASCASACARVCACGGKRSTSAVFFSVYLTLTWSLNGPAY